MHVSCVHTRTRATALAPSSSWVQLVVRRGLEDTAMSSQHFDGWQKNCTYFKGCGSQVTSGYFGAPGFRLVVVGPPPLCIGLRCQAGTTARKDAFRGGQAALGLVG